MIGFIKAQIAFKNGNIFNGDLKLDNLVFDSKFSVKCIDFDCGIFLDDAKESFKIKGFTEGYASDAHIDFFKKGMRVDRDHLKRETRY